MHGVLPVRVVGTDLVLAGVLVLGGGIGWLLLHRPGPVLAAGVLLSGALVLAVAAVSLWRRRTRCGPADRVTLLRLSMTAVCTGGVLLALAGVTPERTWSLAVLAGAAAVLDAVDGRVARHTGTASDAGARFDVEADAVLLLVLSIAVSLVVGPWAVLIGLLRYLFVAAGWLWPRLTAPLPPRPSRRVVAALQAVALVGALLPVTPVVVAAVGLGIALALLCWSFGLDLWRLIRRR
ncbi:CDP-alcohol phosphatidyltransferase family protein [Auraticoccus monumenti]|uniref:CDP-alcohol phosphatidyltransferase n=1 Tax=Auraticoccus monumenti TaxID=675864 RepID=A0A1G6T9E0_9ACTN|nr:CDP-alcohol phosphatidyltransferase family protein [Auraticoccus monumenti]SDD25678.1 CDP-alcohol phosphatidyltransferase [Auraticoccus monumenti]